MNDLCRMRNSIDRRKTLKLKQRFCHLVPICLCFTKKAWFNAINLTGKYIAAQLTPTHFHNYRKSVFRGQSMLSLTRTFQKYLHEYSEKLLQNNLPKIEGQSLGSSVQNFTKDLQKMSTSGLIQNFSSLLKEGDVIRCITHQWKS